MGLGKRSLEKFVESAARASEKTPEEKAAEILATLNHRPDATDVAWRIVLATGDTTLDTLHDDLAKLASPDEG